MNSSFIFVIFYILFCKKKKNLTKIKAVLREIIFPFFVPPNEFLFYFCESRSMKVAITILNFDMGFHKKKNLKKIKAVLRALTIYCYAWALLERGDFSEKKKRKIKKDPEKSAH